MSQRVLAGVLDLSMNYDHHHIGVITHGGVIRNLLFYFPEVIRIFHQSQDLLKDVANCDVYQWDITQKDLIDLKAIIN